MTTTPLVVKGKVLVGNSGGRGQGEGLGDRGELSSLERPVVTAGDVAFYGTMHRVPFGTLGFVGP